MDDFTAIPAPQRHRNGCGFVWTQEDDQQLTTLWPHYSAGAIAKILLPPRTRNAVIGRAHRMGLLMKAKKRSITETPHRKVRLPRNSSPPKLLKLKRQPTVEIAIDPQGWTPIGVPLLEAERQHCRAIIESAAAAAPGNAICCGHQVTHPVFSFCPYHLELFTESARGRRRSGWRHWAHARR